MKELKHFLKDKYSRNERVLCKKCGKDLDLDATDKLYINNKNRENLVCQKCYNKILRE